MITNSIKQLFAAGLVCCGAAAAFTACSDWDDHFTEKDIVTSQMEIYNGDIVSYMKSSGDVSQFSAMFQETGVYDNIFADKEYTFIVCDNQTLTAGNVTDRQQLANYSVSDIAVSPSQLTDGFGIYTRAGKNVWVYGSGSSARLDDFAIKKAVKTRNGYVYIVDGVMPVRQSVYEYLQQLGDDYSTFKALVARNEQRVFDKEHSRVVGVNNEGMTVYDSVFVTRNELMDRYTTDGIATWNMRDEQYITTMFIPTNQQIETAISRALKRIPEWLKRDTTAADREKFEQWIVRACFVNQRLAESEVAANAADITGVSDYQMIVDEQADMTRYKAATPTYWRPSVQTVSTDSKVNLSNGVAYYCTNLKIPNHVVIYRVKSRFYELWYAMDESQQQEFFRWNHWTDPQIIPNCQSEFTLSATLPTMYYHELTAIPDSVALADKLPCSVEFDGLMYMPADNSVKACNLPAGEYYLRMGFKHSLQYSLSISFNDSLLVKDMVMYAQGSNFHFDRGAAAPLPHYGEEGIAYGEGFDPDEWMEIDPKAIAYDTDGYTVGIVTLKEGGNFTIKVESSDMSTIYDPTAARTKNNIRQLMMYHWCLRPTKNNY